MLRRWQEAVAQFEAVTATAQRHAVAAARELVVVSGGLSARQRAAAEQHAQAGTHPLSRSARSTLSMWTYHSEHTREVAARSEAIGQADAVTVDRARTQLAEATQDLLDTYGAQAVEITGQTRRRLNALVRAAVRR